MQSKRARKIQLYYFNKINPTMRERYPDMLSYLEIGQCYGLKRENPPSVPGVIRLKDITIREQHKLLYHYEVIDGEYWWTHNNSLEQSFEGGSYLRAICQWVEDIYDNALTGDMYDI